MTVTHLCSPRALDEGVIEVEGLAYRHLFRARRLAQKERIRVVDGAGRARWAVVESIDGDRAILRVTGQAESGEAPTELTLVVAPPRPERAAWLVEKATEIGVVAVRFVDTERGSRRFGDRRLERMRRVARAAVEQCHRARVPEIPPALALEEALADPTVRGVLWTLDPSGDESLSPQGGGPWTVVVGPEGGWSDAERALLADSGARTARIGERILRVETAAVAAAAMLLLAGQNSE